MNYYEHRSHQPLAFEPKKADVVDFKPDQGMTVVEETFDTVEERDARIVEHMLAGKGAR